MLRTQDFFVPVGGGLTIPIRANYIKYIEGSASGLSARIRVRSDLGGADVMLEPGDSVKLPQGVAQFTIANADDEANISGVLVAGLGEFGSDRVVGTVSVVDTAQARVERLACFSRGMFVTPLAGMFALGQLWNPLGSGVRVVVRSATVGAVANDTAIRLDQSTDEAPTQKSLGFNKMTKRVSIGTPSSKAKLKFNNNAPSGGSITAAAWVGALKAGTQAFPIAFPEPIILLDGTGLTAQALAADAALSVNFDWFEEAV